MPKKKRIIPILQKPTTSTQTRIRYDCSKCPGYCCSYPLIEVGKRDISRLARHFQVSYQQAENKFTKFDRSAKVRSLRHKKDEHFGQICRFFDQDKRRCTVYEARPGVCRQYPDAKRCGYYDFLTFEREQQGDQEFIATTYNIPRL